MPQETSRPSQTEVVVECHSGHTYAQRPTAILWKSERFEVAAIDAEWRSPEGKHFKVSTNSGTCFELVYRETSDDWQIKLI